MSLYAIADLHLSFGVEKPMDIFGGAWEGYTQKLKTEFENKVKPEDTVVIAGDISWGINFEEALEDFKFIEALPGKKIILKGNHDLWWNTTSKMTKFFAENEIKSIDILFNNFHSYNDIAICGTRGWIFKANFKEENDNKIYARELLRLEMSLKEAKKAGFKRFFVFLHYPPVYMQFYATEFIQLMKEYEVEKCIFGHLHSKSLPYATTGVIDGIEYILTSGDYINFSPYLLEK